MPFISLDKEKPFGRPELVRTGFRCSVCNLFYPRYLEASKCEHSHIERCQAARVRASSG